MVVSLVSFLASAMSGGSGTKTLSDLLPSNTSLAPVSSITASDILESLDAVAGMQLTYERRWRYYENDQYSEDSIEARETEVARNGPTRNSQLAMLYNFTRSFFNPVSQTVDMDVDSIFGMDGISFDLKESKKASGTSGGTKGGEDSELQQVLDEIIERSYLEAELVNMLRCGVVTGDTYLCVMPDVYNGETTIYHYPSDMARVLYNPHNRNEAVLGVVSYDYDEMVEDETGNTEAEQHNRTDVFTPEWMYTFRDAEAFDFDGIPFQRENIMGVVPLVHMKNLDVGHDKGIPTFNNVVATLDNINEVVAFLVNIVKMNADPPVIAEGVNPGDLQKGDAENPNQQTVFYISAVEGKSGPSMYLLEWKGNLPDVLGLLKQVKDDVVDSLPEMHVSKMQQQGAYSGQALNAMMFAFVRKITRMRKYYVSKVSQTLSMAMAAQAILDGETTEFTWRDPKYKVVIKLPSVLPVDEDALLNQVMAKLKAGLIGGEQALEELGYPSDEIPDILAEAKSWTDQQMQQQIKVAKATRPVPGPGGGSGGASGGARGNAGAGGAAAGGQKQAAKATNNQPVNKQLNSK
jgi:hypothetical protein